MKWCSKLGIHVNLTTAHHLLESPPCQTKAQSPHQHWILQQVQGNTVLQEIKAK